MHCLLPSLLPSLAEPVALLRSTLASGSNGNDCFLFDRRSTDIKLKLEGHQAAVKALAWVRQMSLSLTAPIRPQLLVCSSLRAQNPVQAGLLATGSGTQDRHLRFFNTTTGTQTEPVDGVVLSESYLSSCCLYGRRVPERHRHQVADLLA